MVPQIVWDFVEEGQAHFGVVEVGIGIGCFGEGDREGTAFQRGLMGRLLVLCCVDVGFNWLASLRTGGLETGQRIDGSVCSRLCSSLRICERSRTLSSQKK